MTGDDARHERFMREAICEAERAQAAGEIPVGAVVVRGGEVIARGHNQREQLGDPTAHAEVVAIRQAAQALGNWRLTGCTLYVTLEPCPMCAGAIVMSRPDTVIYGAADARAGCCGSVYRITEDPAFAGDVPAMGGVLAEECGAMLRAFFQRQRTNENRG